jgi:phage baseplate assembly protein W
MTATNVGFLGRGWRFPIRPDTGGVLRLTEQDEAVRNSIFLILSTAPGERLMRPDYGCGIHDLVFEANTPTLRGTVQSMVRRSLVQWEPRIDVIDVGVDAPVDYPTQLIIRIDYRLRQNNALFNLVYPFYLQESFG